MIDVAAPIEEVPARFKTPGNMTRTWGGGVAAASGIEDDGRTCG
jgi:hypothetical protein